MTNRIKRGLTVFAISAGMVVLAACNKNEGGDILLSTSESEWQTVATSEQPTSEQQTSSIEAVTPEVTTETSEPVTEPTTEPVTEPITEPTTEAPQPTQPDIVVPEIGPSYPAVYPDVKAWDLINNEPLNPQKSGYSELDGLCAAFLNKLKNDGIINDEMTQYQYFRAIYVWYMDHIQYDRSLVDNPGQNAASDPATTPEEVLWAAGLFNTYRGCCYNYSASFAYLMRYVGYDAHILSGQVGSYNGGMTPHCWVYINLDGRPYTFDPDVDMNYYWRDKNAGKEPEEWRSDTWFCRRMDDPNVQYFYKIEKEYFN